MPSSGGGARQKGDRKPKDERRAWPPASMDPPVLSGRAKAPGLDESFGYEPISEGEKRLGWLVNMHPRTSTDEVRRTQRGARELARFRLRTPVLVRRPLCAQTG